MGIDIGGCILSGIFLIPGFDADSAWQWWIESLFKMGWDGRSTI
jgi:hypothetical protein